MLQLLPLAEQTILITGASSGIGLVTARMAARRGARVVLVARNEDALTRAAAEIRAEGGRALVAVADVVEPAQLELAAQRALAEFGGIDTWVNNAGVGLYGKILDQPLADMRRQFEVNYWGTVNGSRVAIPYLARQGGTLINVTSALADRAIPLQGNYCASKHAVKAFSDALRMELEESDVPVCVSVVKPSSMDTPLFQKARTLEAVEPRPIAPVYAPECTARAILECAERPRRDVKVGRGAKMISLAQTVSPRLTDRWMARTTFEAQRSDWPVVPGRRDNLYEPVAHDGGERGRPNGRVKRRSLYTWMALNPIRTLVGLSAIGVGLAAGAARARAPKRKIMLRRARSG